MLKEDSGAQGGRKRADEGKVREYMRSEQVGSRADIVELCTLCCVGTLVFTLNQMEGHLNRAE